MVKSIIPISIWIGPDRIVFNGREPVAATGSMKTGLIQRGLAKELPDGRIFYCGVLGANLKSGDKLDIPDSGLLNISISDLEHPKDFREA